MTTAVCLPLVWSSDTPLTGEELAKARHAVEKVKAILESTKARELDYAQAFRIFADRFKDPEFCHLEHLDLISHVWKKCYDGLINNYKTSTSPPNRPHPSPTAQGINAAQSRMRAQLKQKQELNLIKEKKLSDTFKTANAYFQRTVALSMNTQHGLQQLINRCHDIEQPDGTINEQRLNDLVISLLGSHLVGLDNLAQKSFKIENLYHTNSLIADEINTYYTQDIRLNIFREVCFIQDYLQALKILSSLHLKRDHPFWGYAVTSQQFIDGTLTLNDPSVFMLDGALFHAGVEKVKKAHSRDLTTQRDETAWYQQAVMEIESLSDRETEIATRDFHTNFKIYKKDIATYIMNQTAQDTYNIKKSRDFLAAALEKSSTFSPEQSNLENLTCLTNELSSNMEKIETSSKTKRKKGNKRRKNTKHTPQKKETPLLVQDIKDSSTQTSISPTDVQAQETMPGKALPQRTRTLSQERILSHIQRGTYGPHMPLHVNDSTPRTHMNTKSAGILRALLDPTTRPFTISYQEALNAMSLIGICEKTSAKKGDYRKLIRKGPNDEQVLGRVFAYHPATSTMGHELMKIYRQFIQCQLEDRPELINLITS